MKKQPEVTMKTRQNFVDAFWELIKEKPLNKITVGELTRRAGYNRSTFYEYFMDTDDLLSYVENELLEQLKEPLLEAMPENASLETMFRIVFETMNEKIYLIIGSKGDPTFLPKVRAELLPIVQNYFPIPSDLPEFDYLICFANSAMFALMQRWNEQGKDLSTEEMSKLIQDLVLRGLTSRIDL